MNTPNTSSLMDVSSRLKMLSGKPIPQVGLGTSRTGSRCTEAVKIAIEAGYRHLDTAQTYFTETDIGDALAELIDSGKVTREEMFITTKLSGGSGQPHRVREQTAISLQKLKTGYIDLLLIHFPAICSDEMLDKDPPVFFPRDENNKLIITDTDYVDTYREMEKLVDEGLVKALGVSSFSIKQVERLWNAARIKPTNNQIECHAWFPQYELVEFCQKKGMTVSAYFPLGSPVRPFYVPQDDEVLLQEPIIVEISERLNRTPAQILLRFLVQRNIVVIPKSVNKDRIASNIQLFDFSLSESDLEKIKLVNKGKRLMPPDNLLFGVDK
ncbi:hypothetical protein EB796_012838 [Bugula neritina]|uniref:NADP-dependent oxidoreductase domain-containing protein n=1 Tax=Bugula neritina TaxID=10212 RepID=A0A7J7JSH9_BUGNE|nr:hypothetical protein EB796_012838 [Bugula neritina]